MSALGLMPNAPVRTAPGTSIVVKSRSLRRKPWLFPAASTYSPTISPAPLTSNGLVILALGKSIVVKVSYPARAFVAREPRVAAASLGSDDVLPQAKNPNASATIPIQPTKPGIDDDIRSLLANMFPPSGAPVALRREAQRREEGSGSPLARDQPEASRERRRTPRRTFVSRAHATGLARVTCRERALQAV